MSMENGVLKELEEDIQYLKKPSKRKRPIDIGFSSACREFNKRELDYRMPVFCERDIEKLHYNSSDTLVIAFSGGKLSLACALMYKDIGKDIVLFQVAQPLEDVSRSQKISEMLNVPLVIHKTSGNLDNPYYGMQILHYALEYAVGHQYSPKIVYGYFDSASIENNDRKDWANCAEFIQAYKETAQKYVDGFTILNPVPNYSIMWDEILKHKAYIPYVKYKNEIDRRVFENIRMDYRIDEANKDAYLRNFQYLYKQYEKKQKTSQASLNDVWNEYFFYRIENSLFYKELMEKFVSSI